MRQAAVVVTVAMLLALAPATAASPVADQDSLETDCSPPCGEINPRITFEFPDVGDEEIDLSEGESVTFQGEVVYWTDADDEGHAPSDPSEEIVIRFSFPRLPTWATMSVEPNEINVPVNTCPQCFQTDTESSRPDTNFEYREEIELTITAEEPPEATTGYDYGKLQLFAKSTESGIYNPGYGIREVRVMTDEDLEQQSTEDGLDVPGASALASIAAVALAAIAVRRRG